VAATPFRLFGADHLAALVTVACVGALLCAAVRRGPGAAKAVRVGLAALLLALTALTLAGWARGGGLSIWDVLPLHLCDAAIFLAVLALLTLRPAACELLWFWAGGATALAMLTPDLPRGAPDWGFFSFFALHGSVVIAAAVPPVGLRIRLRKGAPRRALLATNAYAAVVAVVDLAFHRNFLYLREKPAAWTVLEWLGPWPVYLLACEVLAAGLFALLYLPFRER
jgi:hypothetical integral membrane protein (TIGR02206 family)